MRRSKRKQRTVQRYKPGNPDVIQTIALEATEVDSEEDAMVSSEEFGIDLADIQQPNNNNQIIGETYEKMKPFVKKEEQKEQDELIQKVKKRIHYLSQPIRLFVGEVSVYAGVSDSTFIQNSLDNILKKTTDLKSFINDSGISSLALLSLIYELVSEFDIGSLNENNPESKVQKKSGNTNVNKKITWKDVYKTHLKVGDRISDTIADILKDILERSQMEFIETWLGLPETTGFVILSPQFKSIVESALYEIDHPEWKMKDLFKRKNTRIRSLLAQYCGLKFRVLGGPNAYPSMVSANGAVKYNLSSGIKDRKHHFSMLYILKKNLEKANLS